MVSKMFRLHRSEVRQEAVEQLSSLCIRTKKIILKLERARSRRKNWSAEGKEVRVTRREFKRPKDEFRDRSCAARGMWHLMEQRMKDAGRGETMESEHVVRECKDMAEEELRTWNL